MIIWNEPANPFNELLSASEAAEIWGIDQSTIRKAIAVGKLVEGRDCHKFGKQWVVTVQAMHDYTGDWEPWSNWKTKQEKSQ